MKISGLQLFQSRALLVVTLFLIPFGVSSADKLDAFYSDEFRKFSTSFEPLIEQLDRCLKDSDMFETNYRKGRLLQMVLLGTPDCERYEGQRSTVTATLGQLKPVSKSYMVWLKQQRDRGIDPKSIASMSFLNAANELLQIYEVKIKQLTVKTQRVREIEKEVEVRFGVDSLSDPEKTVVLLEKLKNQ